MKPYFFLTLTLLLYHIYGLAQCPTVKIISPSVAEPTQLSVISATCSTLVVGWTGSAGQFYEVSATRYNPSTNKKDTVAGSDPVNTGGFTYTSTIPVVAGTQITWNVQAYVYNFGYMYSYAVPFVLEYPIAPCTGTGVNFSGRLMLQGAYDASTGRMTNTLNTMGILQTLASSQPYNPAPFNYAGLEKVLPGFFAAHTDIVDWVLVELRNANAPSALIATKAAFLKQDGTLTDTGGTNTKIFFPGLAPASYQVAVRHRNHLGIRTVKAIDFSSGNASYDFTTASFRTFSNQPYSSTAQMMPSWGMRGGDANVNQNAKYSGPGNDQNQILNIKLGGSLSRVISGVYAPEDVNMNGSISWSGPGNDQNFLLNIALKGLLGSIYDVQF